MPAGVSKIELPADSALQNWCKTGDFLDCFTVPSFMPARQAAEIITDFPSWAQALLAVRRIVTAPFGLDNDGPDASDKIGIFPVVSETSDEVIAGFNDRHLNFRVSVLSRDSHVSLATWAAPHNFGGRLYLALILPFHVLIARDALRRVKTHS